MGMDLPTLGRPFLSLLLLYNPSGSLKFLLVPSRQNSVRIGDTRFAPQPGMFQRKKMVLSRPSPNAIALKPLPVDEYSIDFP